jgi:hypothetical protein
MDSARRLLDAIPGRALTWDGSPEPSLSFSVLHGRLRRAVPRQNLSRRRNTQPPRRISGLHQESAALIEPLKKGPNWGKEDREVTTPQILAFSCCMLVAGCSVFSPVADEFVKGQNPFAKPFQNREELLEHIPVGTPVEKAKAEMLANGFVEWSRQRQTDRVTLVYHLYDVGGLREDRFVTIYCQDGVVADIQCNPAKAETPK